MKRYIGNTGEVYIVNDKRDSGTFGGRPERNVADDTASPVPGNLFGEPNRSVRRHKPLPGFEVGDIAILAMLFFLYQESGDEEFLIVLAFFGFGIFNK